MTIANDGNVGIGTAAPSFENGTGLEIRYAGGNGAHLKLTDNASGAGGTNGFDLHAFNANAYIENYEAGSLVFRNNGDERMRILNNGYVGIGVSDPDVKFEVNGQIKIDSSISGDNIMAIINSASDGYGPYFKAGGGNTSQFLFKLLTYNNTEKFRVDGDGRVGIGTGNMHDYHSTSNDLVIHSSGNTGMTISGGANSEGVLAFADGTGGSEEMVGNIVYQHASDIMRFGVQNDYPLFLGPKKIVGRTVMNLTTGANRWAPSGTWANLGNSSASSLNTQATGCMYLCEAAIQHLNGYTASMLVFKTSSGNYDVIKITNTSGEMRMSGHNVQYRQQSGADQTGTSGFQRISAVMGTGTAN